jgi:hypothetical protein
MSLSTPVAAYNLDESSGNAADATGGGTLTNTNTVTYSAAVISTLLHVLFEWDSTSSKWECVATA